MAHLSLVVLATISLNHSEGPEAEQVPERFHLERLPIINSFREILYRRNQMLLMDGLVRRV